MRRGSRFFLLALSGIAVIASPVLGQTIKRTELRALRVSVPPKLDGILDDEAWAGPALPLDTWLSYNPINGEPAAQRTSVWIAYDEHAIYFAFKCFDTEPEKIRTALAGTDIAPDQLIVPYRGVKFDATGQNVLVRAILMQVQKGKYCTVYPFELASCQVIYPIPTWAEKAKM